MGEYITTAHRHGKEWFVGSIINQQGGTLDINRDFFQTEKEYLYNLEEDQAENHNLIETFSDKAAELAMELKQWQKRIDAEMPEQNTTNIKLK